MHAIGFLICTGFAVCILPVPFVQAQPAEPLTTTLNIRLPSSTCTISVGDQLDFGPVESASDPTLSGYIAIDPQYTAPEDFFTSLHIISRGTPSAGMATVEGHNVTSYEVIVESAFAGTSLTTHDQSLEFTGAWAHSPQSDGPYDLIEGTSFSGAGAGPNQALTHHFRFGGTVEGITVEKAGMAYESVFALTVTCS